MLYTCGVLQLYCKGKIIGSLLDSTLLAVTLLYYTCMYAILESIGNEKRNPSYVHSPLSGKKDSRLGLA